jgi:hypothetical protein
MPTYIITQNATDNEGALTGDAALISLQENLGTSADWNAAVVNLTGTISIQSGVLAVLFLDGGAFKGKGVSDSVSNAQSFVAFDTSSIPVGETVSSVTHSFYQQATNTSNAGVIEVYGKNWTNPLTTAQFVPKASLTDPILATFNYPSGFPVAGGTKQFTSTSNYLSWINKGGTTRIMMSNQYARLNTSVPSGYETNLRIINSRTYSSGTSAQQLTIVTTAASSPTVYNLIVSPS